MDIAVVGALENGMSGVDEMEVGLGGEITAAGPRDESIGGEMGMGMGC